MKIEDIILDTVNSEQCVKEQPSQYFCLLQRNMSITICVKWSGKEYEVTELAATDTVETLKVGGKDEWNSFEPCTFR